MKPQPEFVLGFVGHRHLADEEGLRPAIRLCLERFAAEAVRRLEDAASRSDVPFFIAVGFAKPHLPFVAPAPYWDLYDPNRFPLPTITRTWCARSVGLGG